MIFRIDPKLPIVWRDPNTIQFGSLEPVLKLGGIDVARERIITALKVGASRSALEMIASSSKLPVQQLDALLEELSSVFEKPQKPYAIKRLGIVGSGSTVDRVIQLLSELGFMVLPLGSTVEEAECVLENTEIDAAILCYCYLLEPGFLNFFCRRDLAHFPIAFFDTWAQIGPLVNPGSSPCLSCLEQNRSLVDSKWAAISSQLLGSRSTIDSGFFSSEVATMAVQWLLDQLDSRRVANESIRLEPGTRSHSLVRHEFSGSCSCTGLTNISRLSSNFREIERAFPRWTTDQSWRTTTELVATSP
ncbi:MAG: hypothetical protein KF867_04185 [Cryobacterium sp.]|nr:hypothetical protein [Cryobacterium sp.]